jgi:signal transduction histidine kinase
LEGFITDITERVMAQQHLEQRVDERTHELTTLLDISHDLASTLDLEPLLDLILDQLGTVVDYDAASIMILEKETLKILAYRGPVAREEALEISFSINKAKANHEVIKRREPVIIEDIRGEDDLARAIRATAGDELETTYSYLRCWMGVPLIVKDQIVGMLTLDHQRPGYYASAQAELAMAFASQAAVAIENARLYFETERRADESETLFSVQQAITSRLEMDEVLQMISDEARRLTNTDISAVYLLKGDELEIAYVSGDVSDSIRGYRLAVEGSIAGRVVKNRTAILVPDTWADPRVDREAADQVQARSLLIVPLESGEEIIGTITVANRTPGGFSQEDKRLLTTLAANVVIALENARLYGQAEQAAVAQERNRLARDLHDAVTQTLFSASLIADVLPKLWQRNPDMGQQKLEELRLLTRGALSEMRTLLFELRPDMLGDVDLADLYRHLANAFTGRTRIPVIYTQEGQSELQPVVKETFYRIAQEGLNNINKHAEASQVQIHLTQDEERVEVIIQDDGCGFDMRSLSPENMGLKIMRERAETVGAEIDIQSAPGAGTRIHMLWEAREEEK